MNLDTDTITAVATPPGRGGVGIVRVSGPAAARVATELLGAPPQPRQAELRPFRAAGDVIDEGIALWFPAPRSFTGEDVLELQAHGGPVLLDMLLEAVLACGVRLAHPGEFSQRAFLNGKLDLAQAEAIADLIDSGSREAARSALRSLQGAFSQRVRSMVDSLTALRVHVESAIDFPDEEIDFLADRAVADRLAMVRAEFDAVQGAATQGRLLRDGMTVVLAGRPNSGKSSLLNALAGIDSAIVTELPGTTRDILREQIAIDGMPLHVIDTAGLREAADPIEREGIRRAWAELEKADRVLLVVDDQLGLDREARAILHRLPSDLPVTLVHNKIDLSGRPAGLSEGASGTVIRLSAKTGAGLDALHRHLKMVMGFDSLGEGTFMARRRHLDVLARAGRHLAAASDHLSGAAGELLAEELRLAQQALGEIMGEFTADDLLGRIFATFCIGK